MAETVSKSSLVAVIVGMGFPEPMPEFYFAKPRKWRFDLAWPAHKIAFEYEGASWVKSRHTSGKGFRDDCIKYSRANILGWCIIRATADMMRSGEAYTLLKDAFKMRYEQDAKGEL
jgi:hypothetical protein